MTFASQEVCRLSFAGGNVYTEKHWDSNDVAGRPSRLGHLLAVEPSGQCLALHMHEGLVKIIPLAPKIGGRSSKTSPKPAAAYNVV